MQTDRSSNLRITDWKGRPTTISAQNSFRFKLSTCIYLKIHWFPQTLASQAMLFFSNGFSQLDLASSAPGSAEDSVHLIIN